MKYILMMSATKAGFESFAKGPKEALQANIAFMQRTQSPEGGLVAAEGLAWPDQAKVVRAGSDGAPMTDRASRNPKSSSPDFGSSTRSPQKAYKIAARASAAPAPAGLATLPIEVRQVIADPVNSPAA